jgi:Cu/Ag efflux protein CusF
MDTASAKIFGNRKIGSLSDVVSQYEVEDAYTQISVDKQPFKVSALKYASFFKWWNNKDKGIPGYVKINPVNSNAEYVELDKGMKYVPSAYFNYNLERHVQLKYPSKIINGYNFEVDDNGKPYYVCPTVTAKVGLFGGVDVNGVIICDPASGDCDYYRINNIPSWVDNVYNGHLLEKKYNWYGLLSDGFINSIIGQKGCKQTTDDFGYKIIGDDVWIYTGVTSVNGDQSNIGFVMMNQRTSEARYYKVSGAEEHSAMAAAEGEVQEKGYKASFPSLINVAGVPTYIMVLKDDGGLVKMYAMVNVSQYNMVATATSQSEVFSNYKKMLAKSGKGENIERDLKTIDIELRDIRFINTDDGTMVYLVSDDGKIFKQAFAENEHLVGLKTGDKLRIEYESSGNDADDIAYMTSYEYIEK